MTAIGIGIYFTKKANSSTEDFFVAGRSLNWFVAGTSIVATSFSADTPLMVAGMSRRVGIFDNWYWWAGAVGGVASAFFFAKLWRRTEVVTDLEFLVRRYGQSRPTSVLRIFKAITDGVFMNCVIMGSVTLAMSKIIKVLMGFTDESLFTIPFIGDVTSTVILLVILGGAAVIYSSMSGLYGVVYTDLVQFGLAMIGCVVLAVMVYVDASSGEGMLAKLENTPGFKMETLNFFPNLTTFNLLTFSFIAYIFISISASSGQGFIIQRILSTRSERDSMLAFLWSGICHFVVRPWPWIVVGVLSIYYLPNLDDPELAFPLMINKFLPIGLKGIMVASLLAAYMSTIDTQLNWGASYLVNDLYKPYLAKGKGAKHYVFISRISMLLLTIIALLVTSQLSSILGAYKYLGVITGGVGTVMIARWYWWRVNAYSEIAALISSLIIGNLTVVLLPSTDGRDLFAVRAIITIVSVAVVWIIVTFITSKRTPDEQTVEFYSKMKIAGPGWKKISDLTNLKPIQNEFKYSFISWISCVAFYYSILLGVGKFIFQQWQQGVVCVIITLISGYVLKIYMGRLFFGQDNNGLLCDNALD